MPIQTVGLHHVTPIASSPQRTLDFYVDVLGLRFVKRTVNFDDPGSYHFYFGDDIGAPGTILTFFLWPGAGRRLAGAGETVSTSFHVPAKSLSYWQTRLSQFNIAVCPIEERLGEQVLGFDGPDGMKLELVATVKSTRAVPSRLASIPPEHAIRGFSGVTLLVRRAEETAAILKVMGFRFVGEEHGRSRFSTDAPEMGSSIDIRVDAAAAVGNLGVGSVHHIAFRAKDDAEQLEWLKEMSKYLSVTSVQDRTYFHSIYFREPGGVLFEMATDSPGFMLDEPAESLGERLCLPDWLERQRRSIERRLEPIQLHRSNGIEGDANDDR